MNIARNNDRSMIVLVHPAVARLEDDTQHHVTAFRDGRDWVIEASGTTVTGRGRTIPEAVENFRNRMFDKLTVTYMENEHE